MQIFICDDEWEFVYSKCPDANEYTYKFERSSSNGRKSFADIEISLETVRTKKKVYASGGKIEVVKRKTGWLKE